MALLVDSAPYRIVPVEKSLGPSFKPALIISEFVNTIVVLFDGSWEVVTPKARLAMSGQLACPTIPAPSPLTCACTSMNPGMMVLPAASTR